MNKVETEQNSNIIQTDKIFPDQVELPIELILHIFSFLTPKDAITLELVSRDWNLVYQEKALWKLFACQLGIQNVIDADLKKAVAHVLQYEQKVTFLDQVFNSRLDYRSLRKGLIINRLIDLIEHKYPGGVYKSKCYPEKLNIEKITFLIQACKLNPNIHFHVVDCENDEKWWIHINQDTNRWPAEKNQWIKMEGHFRHYIRRGITTLLKIKPKGIDFDNSSIVCYDEEAWTSLKTLIKNGEATLRLGETYYQFNTLLPVEIILHIFSFLDLKDLATAQLVNRKWKEIGNNQTLWHAFAKTFHIDHTQNWKFAFARKYIIEKIWQEIQKKHPNNVKELEKKTYPESIKNSDLGDKAFLKATDPENSTFIVFKKRKNQIFTLVEKVNHNSSKIRETHIDLQCRYNKSKKKKAYRVLTLIKTLLIINEGKDALTPSHISLVDKTLFNSLKCLIDQGSSTFNFGTKRPFKVNVPIQNSSI